MSDTPRLSEQDISLALDHLRDQFSAPCEKLDCDATCCVAARGLAELRSLRAIAREIGSCTPTLDDERLPYVELQVDRGSWEEVQRYAK